MAKIYLAFASITVGRAARTQATYNKWVGKLATKEYADELVVLAVALELGIRICCIPHTPASSSDPWAPSSYGTGDATIYIGNNDVHYVYLSQAGLREGEKARGGGE